MRFVLQQARHPGDDYAQDLFAVLVWRSDGACLADLSPIKFCTAARLDWAGCARRRPSAHSRLALIVAYLPPIKQAGRTGAALWCVSGISESATIIFGISKVFWLSLGMLFLAGAVDSVSVIIRGSIVQLVTPDNMRGRVSAVNNIFIGTSNEFGALESGFDGGAVWSGAFRGGRGRLHDPDRDWGGGVLAGDAEDRAIGQIAAMIFAFARGAQAASLQVSAAS